MSRAISRSVLALAPVAIAMAAAASTHAALTFTVTYDPSFDVAAIPTINAALAQYSSLFNDNVNVSLKMSYSGSGLGTSSTYSFAVPYQTYRNALAADATSAADATALAHLPIGVTNPANGTGTVMHTRPGLAAMGIPVDVSGIANYFDGEIDLNLGLMNYTRSGIDPAKYDLQAVFSHELNEVLGTISNVGEANPRAADMYRYTAAGARTFTTAGDDAYFSLDGTTALARYNQTAGADYGDWWSTGPHAYQVQDAFGTPGAFADLGVEITALDAVGYTRVPAPGAAALLGLGGLAIARRRRTLA